VVEWYDAPVLLPSALTSNGTAAQWHLADRRSPRLRGRYRCRDVLRSGA